MNVVLVDCQRIFPMKVPEATQSFLTFQHPKEMHLTVSKHSAVFVDMPKKNSTRSTARVTNSTKSKAKRQSQSRSRKTLERDLQLRSHALAERMKELGVIHSVSDLFEAKNVELGEILQRIVDLLPTAWQYPEFACARVTLGNRTYQNANFREPRWQLQEHILVDGEKVGALEVGYCESLPDGTQPEFLVEEEDLLITLAGRLSEAYSLKESQLQLSTYQQHLRSLASELTLTEERERRQLALHLHDSIGQGLAVAKLKLETLRSLLPQEHKERVENIIELLQQIIGDTRSITAEISPPILYELSFHEALVWLADHFQKQFGITIEVRDADQMLVLGEGVRVMLYRSIQELLTNVVKHAQATRVEIRVDREDNAIHACVADNGVGFSSDRQHKFPSASGGFGMFSIRERFAHLGGRVTVESSPGKGARVHLWVPAVDRIKA